MLKIAGLVKRYRGSKEDVLRGVDLEIAGGTVVALLGRSGCGKTTLARCLTGLEPVDRGVFHYAGAPFQPEEATARRRIQLVWQDPLAALSPYRRVRDSIGEPLDSQGLRADEQTAAVRSWLEFTGLASDRADCYPFQLSVGECQRAALARALVASPSILVLDEPLVSLDPVAQQELIPVLRRATKARTLSVLLISHDLGTVALLADRIAFLNEGKIQETQDTEAFLRAPESLHAREFLAAARESSFRLPRET
jgi:ABC-type dipeptide/oligopeptide/nickel transport system ATPase subunit